MRRYKDVKAKNIKEGDYIEGEGKVKYTCTEENPYDDKNDYVFIYFDTKEGEARIETKGLVIFQTNVC